MDYLLISLSFLSVSSNSISFSEGLLTGGLAIILGCGLPGLINGVGLIVSLSSPEEGLVYGDTFALPLYVNHHIFILFLNIIASKTSNINIIRIIIHVLLNPPEGVGMSLTAQQTSPFVQLSDVCSSSSKHDVLHVPAFVASQTFSC